MKLAKRFLVMNTDSVYNQDFANHVVNLCIAKYNKLPKTGKPNVNESQWTLLSGICLEEDGKLSVVALGTGTKSLGVTSYSKNGDVVIDSHAEVLTRRAWLRYLYSQMNLCLTGQASRIFNPIAVDIVNKYRNISTQNISSANSVNIPSEESKQSQNNVSESRVQEVILNSLEEKNDSREHKDHFENNTEDINRAIANNKNDPPCPNENRVIHDDNLQKRRDIQNTTNSLELKFSLRPDIKFHFYTSHTPCGDASIFPRHIKATTLAKIQTQTQRYKIQKDFLKRRKLASSVDSETEIPDNSREDDLNIHPCEKPRADRSEEIDHTLKGQKTNDLASSENVEETESFQTSNTDSSSEDSGSEDSLSGDVGSMVQDFHRTGAKTLPHASHKDPKRSGPEFHLTGVPRTKPGRGDPTYSMSCSDKIAKWNAVGWEGSLISTLLESPIHMSSITVGGGIAFSMEALQRALTTRISHLLPSPPPVLLHSQVIFPAGKRSVKREMKRQGRPICSAHPVGGCIIWSNVTYKALEVAIEGIRQGVSRKLHNRTNTSSTLLVSSYKLLLQYIQLCKKLHYLRLPYSQIKAEATEYQARLNKFKQALGNWLEVPEEFRQFTVTDINEKL